MKNLFKTYFVLIALAFMGCSEDDANDNNDDNGDNNNQGISLSEVTDGNGIIGVTGDLDLTIEGDAVWESTTDITSNGVTYSRWIVTVDGANTGEEVSIQIVEDQDASTQDGPDDGEYILGGSMDENDVSIYTDTDSYFFVPSSTGSFTISRGASDNILEIVISANGMEKGGIGADEIVDLEGAIKANQL